MLSLLSLSAENTVLFHIAAQPLHIYKTMSALFEQHTALAEC